MRVARIVGLPTSSTARTAIATRPDPPSGPHAGVPDDVLHDDDRIVDEDADREDQGKERDPVQRVAVRPEREQRQRERDRNRGQDDECLPEPERQRDEERHRHDGEEHVVEELVRFLCGRLAVVSRDRDVQIAGQEYRPHRRQLGFDLMRDGDGVGALALRHGQGDRGMRAAVPRVEADVRRRRGVAHR